MYNKILNPIDGSKPSISALKHAARIGEALRNPTEITVLFVVENILLPPLLPQELKSHKTGEMIDAEGILKEMYQDEKKRVLERLEKIVQSLRSEHVSIRIRVAYGPASQKILEEAAKGDYGLIVIGNVGLSGLSKLKAIGSVSRTVSERAQCPVLIVH